MKSTADVLLGKKENAARKGIKSYSKVNSLASLLSKSLFPDLHLQYLQ